MLGGNTEVSAICGDMDPVDRAELSKEVVLDIVVEGGGTNITLESPSCSMGSVGGTIAVSRVSSPLAFESPSCSMNLDGETISALKTLSPV